MSFRGRLAGEEGGSLVLAMAVLTALSVFCASGLALAGVGAKSVNVSSTRVAQTYAADAGMEWAIRELVADPTICSDTEGSVQSHEWAPMPVNGHTVTFTCEWLASEPRTVRLIATVPDSDDPVDGATTMLSATVQPDDGPIVSAWNLREESWESPGASPTTTTTVPPTTTTTTVPPTTTTTPPSTTTTTTTTTTTVPPSTTTTTAMPSLTGSWYLKTSGSGNRTSSTPLPLANVAPTATWLPNYDTNRDSSPGLLIEEGSGEVTESSTARYQEWSLPITANTRLRGNVSLQLWSAMKDFDDNRRGNVVVYLRDCNSTGSSCTTIASDQVERSNWQGTSSTWVSTTFDFGAVDRTLAANRSLRLKVLVDNRSHADMWFAYDTTTRASRIVVG